MTVAYEAVDLAELAAEFRRKAEGIRKAADFARTHRSGHEMLAEARTWEAAASIIDNTTLTGDKS